MIKRLSKFILPFSIFLTAILVFFQLATKSFWFDETYGVFIAQKSLHDMFYVFWSYDGNSWLYYVLLHFWIKFGNTEIIVRTLSAIFAILSIPTTYILASKMFNSKIAKLSVLLLSMNVFFIGYAQEARGYTLLVLLTTLSTYFFVQSIEDSRSRYWTGYVVCVALSFYTHIFTLLVVASQILTVLLFRKEKLISKKFILSFITLGIFIFPFLLLPALKNGQIDWIGKPNFKDFVIFCVIVAGGLPLLSIAYFCIFVTGTMLFFRKKSFSKDKFWQYGLVLFSFSFPIAFTFLFSLIKPIYVSRYLLISLVPFIILASACLVEIMEYKKWLFYVLISTIAILSSMSLYVYYSGNKSIFGPWSIDKYIENWRGAANFVAEKAKPDDAAITYIYIVRIPFDYYLEDNEHKTGLNYPKVLELASGLYAPGGGSIHPFPNTKLLSSLPIKYDRIWLILSHNDGYLANSQTILIQRYLSKSYKLRLEKSFERNINVLLYTK